MQQVITNGGHHGGFCTSPADDVASTWTTERWDSLHPLPPVWLGRLSGLGYRGPAPLTGRSTVGYAPAHTREL